MTRLALAALLLAAGCSGPAPDAPDAPGDRGPARILGLVAGNPDSFRMVPDGCGLTAFFGGTARIDHAGRVSAPRDSVARHIEIAFSPAARGASMRVDLRGAFTLAAGRADPRLVLRAAGRDYPVSIPADEGAHDLMARFELAIPDAPAPLRLEIEAKLPKPADGATEASLAIEDVDIVLGPATGCRIPDDAAPPAANATALGEERRGGAAG